jgi:spore coat protein CotH
MQQEIKLVKKFDKNGDGWLNLEERNAAREYLKTQQSNRGPGGRRGGRPGFGPPGRETAAPKPGPKLTPSEVKSFPDAPLYASNVLRTVFLEFESADWEKELAEFKNTDVEVPAKMTVDGKVYPDVGVHFHGMSSFMMVGEGSKRSLTISTDLIHDKQQLGGYNKIDLLNSHEDPSFLRTVLSMQIARDYVPAPKANLMRVVINGESWGIYVNQQHFNKEFLSDYFGTTKGARWKVQGSPGGRGGLNYLGEDAEAYKRIYDIKSKDEAKSWTELIGLCKALTEESPEKLEKTLPALLDVDGALKFFAWDNALANGDGFWTRASDYSLYRDQAGRFHIIPYDANETFSMGGGPGGPGGFRGPGGPGGPGGRGGFGPGMFVAPQILDQADKNADGKLSKEEFTGLADAWFEKLDPDKTGKLTQEQFVERLGAVLPPPQGQGGFGPPGGQGGGRGQRGGGGRGGFGPAMFIGPGLFAVADANKDGSLTRAELEGTFAKWFSDWDTAKSGTLDEQSLSAGLTAVLPRPNFGGPGGGFGGRGPGGGPGGGGVALDPVVSLTDASKPLISKLLAVPAFKARYLGYVHDIAEKWLDWNKLGPVAQQYHELIAEDVKIDTRKLDSTEEFQNSLSGEAQNSLKNFAEKRRAFLLKNAEVKAAKL